MTKWALPVGRKVSPIDFDLTGWAPVTLAEASLLEEWGREVVYFTVVQRQYWAQLEDALAARTVSTVCLGATKEEE